MIVYSYSLVREQLFVWISTVELIINADDFGLNESVNDAIMDCHHHGSVSSASMMVNMPGFDHACSLLDDELLGVGLHFNLTEGEPLSPAFRRLLPRNRLLLALLTGEITQSSIEQEFLAQLSRLRAEGIKPSHIDSHQHIHIFPGVFRVVSEYCARENIALRIPWTPPVSKYLGLGRSLSRLGLNYLNWYNIRRGPALVTNSAFVSIFDITKTPGEADLGAYLEMLSGIETAFTEVMVHPSKSGRVEQVKTSITDISTNEYEMLMSEPFLAALSAGQFTLTDYRTIPTRD